MSNDQRNWYIIRATYSREMVVKRQLDKLKIRNYVPMRLVEVSVCGRKRLVRRPCVHNLVFVRITAAWLGKLKQTTDMPFNYFFDRSTRQPVIVPEKEMNDFIYVSGGGFDDVQTVDLTKEELQCGDRVRITAGAFKGIEGEYIRYNSKNRVVVKLMGIVAVLTAEIPQELVEKI